MKKILIMLHAALMFLGFATGQVSWADSDYDTSSSYDDTLFTAEELDDLLAPIALYPDPLLAQVLPAATFIDQIDEASRYVREYGKSAQIDIQFWDVSVKAVAHYPDVLFMMDQKYDWTVSLGQAFVNQQEDVMYAIQRLRAEAMAAGNLVSTRQQQVIIEEEYIRIVPVEPEVIYVPEYDPLVVYYERPSLGYGFITFGIGFTIGAWLNRDFDWHGRRVYYHGWHGGGWIGHARPHIQARNNVYINNNYRVINVNRNVVHHDTVRYREQIRRDVQTHREKTGRPVPLPRDQRSPGKVETRGEKPRSVTGEQSRPSPSPRDQRPAGKVDNRGGKPVSPTTVTSPPALPATKDVSRGRDIQKAQPASRSGYGGYGSSREATKYRERGKTSQENMRQINRPAAVQRPAAIQRPAPAQRPAVSGDRQPAPHRASPADRGKREQRQKR